jgi:ABC-type Fe3+-hydroxamate transport system substrate-binding protein
VEADTFDVERVAEVLRRTSDVRGLISSTELSQPALADVPAVRNKRFVVLPLTATLAGVRSAYAVGDLARGIHPESFE